MKGHKKILIFNGKKYYKKGTFYNKEDAEIVVKSAKVNGYSARLVKRIGKGFGYAQEPMYAVYIRKRGR
jgi:hypothetical protein